eukprot:scaffold2880_cov67-Phaeocystis_antarctica.AAC.2
MLRPDRGDRACAEPCQAGARSWQRHQSWPAPCCVRPRPPRLRLARQLAAACVLVFDLGCLRWREECGVVQGAGRMARTGAPARANSIACLYYINSRYCCWWWSGGGWAGGV